MAESANDDSVAAAARPPQYRKAVQTIRGDIKKKGDRISGINGEINDAWGKIAGMGVDKNGARIFQKLDKLEPDERADAVRTLQGMIAVSDWPELQDLVDEAEGTAASYSLVPAPDGDDDADGDGDGGKPATRAEALKKARKHFGVAEAPDALDGPTVQ